MTNDKMWTQYKLPKIPKKNKGRNEFTIPAFVFCKKTACPSHDSSHNPPFYMLLIILKGIFLKRLVYVIVSVKQVFCLIRKIVPFQKPHIHNKQTTQNKDKHTDKNNRYLPSD